MTVSLDSRYPVGPFQWDGDTSDERRLRLIETLEQMPARLRAAVDGLSAGQIDRPYRPGGWTVRQVVHHVADSHLNAYVRFRLALTEQEPTIKPYDQERWAELADARTAPIDVSLALIESLHQRWVLLLRSLSAADFARTFRHPELGIVSLDKNLAMYAWHGRHHTAHIQMVRQPN